MFKDLSEVKEFILWAKENKVSELKVENIEFKLSPLSFVDEKQQATELKEAIGDTLVDTQEISQKELEELMYWSVNK